MLNDELHPFRWYEDTPPTVPTMKVRDDPALREETDRLLAFEKEDMKELRRLRKDLRWSHGNPHGDPLLPLLVDLMLRDTAKHIDILQFIRAGPVDARDDRRGIAVTGVLLMFALLFAVAFAATWLFRKLIGEPRWAPAGPCDSDGPIAKTSRSDRSDAAT